MNRGPRSVTLVKGGHRFVFRYAVGRESDLLATFVSLAEDPESVFDWLDAAALSYQMGRKAPAEPAPAAHAAMGQTQ